MKASDDAREESLPQESHEGPRGPSYRIASDVVMRDIDGGLLLVNLRTGSTWKLNATGAAACRALEKAASVAEVQFLLAGRFAVGEDVLRRDLEGLFAALVAEGLVEAV